MLNRSRHEMGEYTFQILYPHYTSDYESVVLHSLDNTQTKTEPYLNLTEEALAPKAQAPPLSLQPLFDAADELGDNGATRLFINSYAKIIDQARFGRREPKEEDAAACEKVVDVVLLAYAIFWNLPAQPCSDIPNRLEMKLRRLTAQ